MDYLGVSSVKHAHTCQDAVDIMIKYAVIFVPTLVAKTKQKQKKTRNKTKQTKAKNKNKTKVTLVGNKQKQKKTKIKVTSVSEFALNSSLPYHLKIT